MLIYKHSYGGAMHIIGKTRLFSSRDAAAVAHASTADSGSGGGRDAGNNVDAALVALVPVAPRDDRRPDGRRSDDNASQDAAEQHAGLRKKKKKDVGHCIVIIRKRTTKQLGACDEPICTLVEHSSI